MRNLIFLVLAVAFLFSCTEENEKAFEGVNSTLETRSNNSYFEAWCENCGTQFPGFDVFASGQDGVRLTWGQDEPNHFHFELTLNEFHPWLPLPLQIYSRDINMTYFSEFIDAKLLHTSIATYWVKCLNCDNGSSVGWKNLLYGSSYFEEIMRGKEGDCLKEYPEIEIDYVGLNNFKIVQPYTTPVEKDLDHLKIDRLEIREYRNGAYYNTSTMNIEVNNPFTLPSRQFSAYDLRFYSSECPRNDLHYITTDYKMSTTQIPPLSPHRVINMHEREYRYLYP